MYIAPFLALTQRVFFPFLLINLFALPPGPKMGDATMRGEVEAELDKLVGMDKVKDFFTNLRETVEYVERREEPTPACSVLLSDVCVCVCVA